MRARLGLLLAAAVLSAPLWMLGHPLWEVDDARYAEIPREMAAMIANARGNDHATKYMGSFSRAVNSFSFILKPNSCI